MWTPPCCRSIRDTRRRLRPDVLRGRTSVYVVRPDGYLSFASSGVDIDDLVAHLSSTFA